MFFRLLHTPRLICIGWFGDVSPCLFSENPLPGRLHRGLESSLRGGRREALVRLYAGATTGVDGVVQGVQERPDLARVCQRSIAPQLVVS